MKKQPRTAVALKKHRYSVSVRMPNGMAYDPAQCGWIVYESKDPRINWQCSRKSGYGKNKLWCPNHAVAHNG